MSSDMFDLVRSHLMETNALGQAEELLLKRMLDNPTPKQANRIPAMAPSALAPSGSKGVIDALKISDLLGEMEDSLTSKPKVAYVPPPEPAPVAKDLPLDELEKIAEEEIWLLEQKKLALKRQMEDKRAEAERAKILEDLSKPNAEQQRSLRALKDEVFSASHQLQKNLRNVSDQHQKLISQQRSHTLNAQRELQSLQRGDWSASSSLLLAEKLGRPAPTEAAESTSMSDELIRKSRVQQLLTKMQGTENISQRRQRISDLRNKEKQVQEMEERAQQLVQSTPRNSSTEATTSSAPSNGLIDRALPAGEFLDRWLQEEIRPAASTDRRPSQPGGSNQHVNKAKPVPSPETSSASPAPRSIVEEPGLAPHVQAELQRLLQENQQLKASLGQLAEDGGENPAAGGQPLAARRRRAGSEGLASPEKVFLSVAPDITPSIVPQGLPPSHLAQPMPYAAAPHASSLYPTPWGGYGPQPVPGQAHPHSAFPFQSAIPPGFYPQAPVPAALDPAQQAMLAQMQRIAEQLEKENSSLTALGMALPSSNPAAAAAANPVPNPLVRNLHDPAPSVSSHEAAPFPASSATYPAVQGLSRQEQRQQEEIRMLQYELEKLKRQKDLDDFKLAMASQRLAQRKADEHQQWLEEQKRELQALKMKQLLAKEQRLLQYQAQPAFPLGGGGDSGEEGNGTGSPQRGRGGMSTTLDQLREECGVGVTPVPYELAKGVTILVDGVWIRKQLASLHTTLPDTTFRVVAGVYDRSGQQSLVKLSATAWQVWRASDSPSAIPAPGFVQSLDDLLVLTVRPADLASVTDGLPSSLLGTKCLFELQVKTGAGGERARTSGQKSVGWAVFPLFAASPSPAAAAIAGRGGSTGETVVLKNGAWKVDLQSGLSDPTADAQRPPQPATGEQDGNSILFRILDSAENYRGSAWKLATALSATATGPAVEAGLGSRMGPLDVLKMYSTDGLARSASELRLQPVASSVSLLNQRAGGGGGGAGGGLAGRASSLVNLSRAVSRRVVQTPSSQPGTPNQGAPSSRMPDRLASLGSMYSLLGGNPLDRLAEEGDEDARGIASPHDLSSGKGGGGGPSGSLQSLGITPGGNGNGLDRQSWWLLGPTLGPCTERYQRGDGIDIYIDRCLFLPDNCTLTRVSVRLFSAGKEQVGPVHQGLSLADSPAISPVFKMKAECRGNVFPSTTTILFRLDTLDASTLVPVSTGYACLKMFATRDRQQPKATGPGGSAISSSATADQAVYINTGAFQLPLYGGRIPNQLKSFDEEMLSTMPRIPCGSILVRILAAPKSADGISTLSRDEFPQEDWQRLGLDIPAPAYGTGAYYGAWCEPSSRELQGFEVKASLYLSLTVETAVLQAMNARKDHDLPDRPSDPNPEAMQTWLSSLLPPLDKMRRMLDYTLAVPYSVEAGLAVKIVQLFNLPEASLFSEHSRNSLIVHKVIASLSPPGLFYKDPPLVDGVHYTRFHQWDSYQRAPRFLDDYMEFLPAEMSFGLYLILDIRCVVVEAKKSKKKTIGAGPSEEGSVPLKITVEPPTQRKSFWTLLPLARERCPGQGFRHCQSGFFQLPLMEGPVPEGEVFRAMNPFKEVLQRLAMKKQAKAVTNAAGEATVATPLKLAMDSASVLVKVYNPLLRDLVLPDLEPAASAGGGGGGGGAGGSAEALQPDVLYLTAMLEAAAQGQTGGTVARMDKFAYSAAKFSAENRHAGKTLAQLRPVGLAEDYDLTKAVNDAFATATGITALA